MRIQHNIPAMNSYRNYSNNVSAVAKNLEKLSTGYKINRAGDDAAGLAISEKMRIQITGLEKAQDNAKSGINLVQTAEGALTEVHDMLNRMYDLAEQSANGTFDDDTDRKQLQKEVDSLRDEINRIADGTNYNGIKLLDGSMASKTVASGAVDVSDTTLFADTNFTHERDGQLAGQAAQVGIFSLDLKDVVLKNNDKAADQQLTFTFGGMTITPTVTVRAGQELKGQQLANAIAENLNAQIAGGTALEDGDQNQYTVEAQDGVLRLTMTDLPKVSMSTSAIDLTMSIATYAGAAVTTNQGNQWNFTVEQQPVGNGEGRVYAQASMDLTEDVVKDGGTLTIGKETYVFAVGKNSIYKDYANVIDLTDKKGTDDTTNTAPSADLLRVAAARLTQAAAKNESFYVGTDFTADGTPPKIFFTEKEGAVDYAKNNLAGVDGISDGAEGQETAADATEADWAGLIMAGNADAAKSTRGLTLQIGDTAEDFNQLNVSVADMHTTALGLDKIDISLQGNAQDAMDAIKKATNMVSDVRGGLGAIQNRLDHTINNLSVAQENIQDAEANIRDVDVAKEMMAYTKNNILVQSAQAMLAQANQLPQGVLQLLG